jgi:glycosyltransferase involved in cell wall biosynthesis
VTEPLLSVVIPTYCRPEALARTLQALAKQELEVPWEVVVCDDGSPPEQVEQARAAAAAVRAGHAVPVTVVAEGHRGPAAARNAGARAARGPLLAFLDDDCLPAPGWLAAHWQAHRRGERLAVVGHVAWDPALRVTPFMELVARGAQFHFDAIADPERVPFSCFYTANCSLSRADLDAAGWFDATLPPFMEDTEFAYRLTQCGVRIVYRPQALVYHTHAVALASYLERQRKAGQAAVQVAQRHPELFELVGVGDVADVALREQFYTALLRYAFVLGVEDGLMERARAGAITGAELRSQFEGWLAHWAVRQASTIRAWRERARALEQEVRQRDEHLALVVQEKDARIAALEAELRRLHRLPPLRLYRTLRRLVSRWLLRHNG